jgi:uncharacterized protein involved in exopolysaccharide biosynthesis
MLKALKTIDYVILAALTLLSLLIGIVYLHLCPHLYQANMVVMASTSDNQGQSASTLSSMLMRGGNSTALDTYSEVFLSPQTAGLLAKDNTVMRHYFRDEWDATQKQLRQRSSLVGNIVKTVKFLITGMPVQQAAANERLLAILRANVKTQKDNKTLMVHISCTDRDPAMAAYVLRKLHLASDTYLRSMAQQDADETSRTIEKRLSKVSSIDLRYIAVSTVINQEVTRLLTSSYASYMIRVIVPPTPESAPISPKPNMILLFALVLGCGVPATVLIRWRNGLRLYGFEMLLTAMSQWYTRRHSSYA